MVVLIVVGGTHPRVQHHNRRRRSKARARRAMFEERPMDSIRLGDRIRADLGDVEGLAASIADIGLLHPIVIAPDGMLLAGARRYEAMRQLGRTTIPCRIVEGE